MYLVTFAETATSLIKYAGFGAANFPWRRWNCWWNVLKLLSINIILKDQRQKRLINIFFELESFVVTVYWLKGVVDAYKNIDLIKCQLLFRLQGTNTAILQKN
jgi:succinyl-CoA synthetase beta subunit